MLLELLVNFQKFELSKLLIFVLTVNPCIGERSKFNDYAIRLSKCLPIHAESTTIAAYRILMSI